MTRILKLLVPSGQSSHEADRIYLDQTTIPLVIFSSTDPRLRVSMVAKNMICVRNLSSTLLETILIILQFTIEESITVIIEVWRM